MVRIRAMKKEDIRQVLQLEEECFPPDFMFSEQDLRAILHPDSRWLALVAYEFHHAVVGHLIMRPLGDAASLQSCAVGKPFRRLGIATKLLREARELFPVSEFVCVVRDDFLLAQQWLRTNHFTAVEIERGLFGNHDGYTFSWLRSESQKR